MVNSFCAQDFSQGLHWKASIGGTKISHKCPNNQIQGLKWNNLFIYLFISVFIYLFIFISRLSNKILQQVWSLGRSRPYQLREARTDTNSWTSKKSKYLKMWRKKVFIKQFSYFRCHLTICHQSHFQTWIQFWNHYKRNCILQWIYYMLEIWFKHKIFSPPWWFLWRTK